MCAITGSFNKNKLVELYKLNSYRGELSYSIGSFSRSSNRTRLDILIQDQGKMPGNLIDSIPYNPGQFFVAHSQAPTQGSSQIHPAVYEDVLLWHNGIIKQKSLPHGVWDTEWLVQNISDYGWSVLSRVDGTFACIMFRNNNLYVFRNEISPLFIDSDFNISSTKFEGSRSLPPNVVFKLDITEKKLDAEATFQTLENPYFIPEEAT